MSKAIPWEICPRCNGRGRVGGRLAFADDRGRLQPVEYKPIACPVCRGRGAVLLSPPPPARPEA